MIKMSKRDKEAVSKLSKPMQVALRKWPCRFCKNLVKVSPPRAKFVAACQYRLRPPRCGKFKFYTGKAG